jgi:PAS domain S-box-containing protein
MLAATSTETDIAAHSIFRAMSLHDHRRIQERLTSLADPVGFLVNLFAHAPVGFAVWSADGRPLLTNKAFMDIFLVEPPPEYNVLKDELLAANGMLPLFQRAFQGETVHVPTFWYDPREHTAFTLAQGRRVAVSMTIFPLFGEGGQVDYVAATYKDETEIMQANERLRRGEEDLRITLESIGDAVIATDASGAVTRMNPVAEQLTGWSMPEAAGRSLGEVFRIVHEETRAPVESPVDRVLREGVVVGLANHTLLLSRDGTERAIADSGAPIRDAQGGMRGVVLVFQDQTAERKVERFLRRSEARFRRLADAGILGIITTDLRGNILEANDTFLRSVGYGAEEVLSGTVRWVDMTPAEWRPFDERAIEQLKATGVAAPWEKEYVHRDGSRVPVLVGVAMLDASSGECVAFILDLTERKRAELAARESEARKAAVMEAALDAVILMDHEGTITEYNAAAERTFGYSREEVIGKPLGDVLVPPALRDRHRMGLRRHLETGERSILGRRIEVPAMRKGGAEFPAEVAVVRIDTESAPLFTGYVRDITERRQAAEAELLRREKEAADAANRELEAFSYSVAHDLRAPLRGISGFSGALLEDYGDKLDEGGRALIARVMASTKRMGLLIDALLALARLSRTEVRHEVVNMTEAARSIIEQLRVSEPSRSVEFVATDGITAIGDPQLLRSVLENLLSNAWKFTKNLPHARIELGCAAQPDAIQYYVRDNGAGFDMRFAHRLFSPFQRLHATADFEGTGVGLATVQRIIHRHGGRVWAESEESAGATFHFSLPEAAPTKGTAWTAAT